MMGRVGTPIRIEKVKWDGRVTAVHDAHVVAVAPPLLAWYALRARPGRGPRRTSPSGWSTTSSG